MARYRKIDVMMWSDEKFLDLSDKAMLVFIFILTCPLQTSLGAMRASVEGLAQEFLNFPGISRSRWSLKAFRSAFREISDKEIVFADANAAVIWLPNFLKHNRPTNINVVKSWVTVLETLPECETKTRIVEHMLLVTKQLGEDYLDAFKKGMQDTFGNKYLNRHPNKPESNTPLVPKQTPKQTAIQEQEAGAGTGDINRKQEQQAGAGYTNRKQEQEHRNPHSTPMLLSDILKENTPALLNYFSWDWWKPRLEEVQIRVWETIGLQEEELHTLIDGVDGESGFRDAGALYLAIEETKTKPNYPYKYLKKKAEDQETVNRFIKKAGSMSNEEFEKGTSQVGSLTDRRGNR